MVGYFFCSKSYFCVMKKEPGPSQEEKTVASDWYERVSLTVDGGQEPVRIDKFLKTRIEHATRNKIQQAAQAGMICVNGNPVKPNYKVKPGDEIIVYTTKEPVDTRVIPEDLPLDIRYEDEAVMVIHKPAGMVVHPGNGNYTGTLLNGLAWYLGYRSPEGIDPELSRFGLVHRIDKDTSGLLVIGKTEQALSHLAKQFFDHSVDRTYLALAWGDFEKPEGSVAAYIGRNPRFRKKMAAFPEGGQGKPATTHYKVLERFHYVTLLECRLETGRTHQIRVHMQHIGHPLFNDSTYGGDRIIKGTIFTKYRQFINNCFSLLSRQALHARSIGFVHPRTGERMHFDSELPEDFKAVLEKWRKYVKR